MLHRFVNPDTLLIEINDLLGSSYTNVIDGSLALLQSLTGSTLTNLDALVNLWLVDLTGQTGPTEDLFALYLETTGPLEDAAQSALEAHTLFTAVTDIFNLLQNSPTYTGGALTVTDHEGTLVTSPANTAGFEGGRLATTVAEGATLGPELVVNGGDPFTDTANIGAIGVTLSLESDNLVITANDGTADRAEWGISGLTVGNLYRVEIVARSGVGSQQYINAFTWGLISAAHLNAEFTSFIFDIQATATSGVSRIYVALSGGNAGDTAIVKSFSIKEVIPTWYDTDLEGNPLQPLVSIPTKAGSRKWYTEPFDGPFGYSNWPARTNLFLNSNTPVTQNITTTAQAYTISVLGTGDVTVSGTASGTATAGSPLTVTATAGTLTCTVTGTLSRVQVEAGAFASPWIETLGTTVTRAATNLSMPTAGVLPVNDFGIWGEVIPGASGQPEIAGGAPNFFNSFTDASREFRIGPTAVDGLYILRKRIASINYDILPTFFTYTKDTPFQYMAFQSRVYGMGIRVKEQGGAWSAWALKDDADGRLDAPIASTYQIGARNNANHFAGTYPGLAIIQHQDPKAELERLATLYEE
jgi:hypothetical protein